MIENPVPESPSQHESRVDCDRDHVDDVLPGDGHIDNPLPAQLVSPSDGTRVGVQRGHDPAAAVLVALGPDDDGSVLWGLPEPRLR